MSEATDLTKALRDLTAELKLQRGIKPDASFGDEPEPLLLRDNDQTLRLIEPLVETSPKLYGRIMTGTKFTGNHEEIRTGETHQ